MAEEIHVGDRVAWNWGSSHAEGVVKEVSDGKMEREIKGKHITRNGTADNPAAFVERPGQKNPTPVVKKASELHVLGQSEEVSGNKHVATRRQGKKEDAEQQADDREGEEEEEVEEEDEEDDEEEEDDE